MATRFCSVIALSLSIAASSIGLATDISFPLVWRKTCTKGGKDHSFFRFSLKSVVSWHFSMTFFGCFTLAHTATSRKPRTWHGPGIFTRAEAAPPEGLQLFFPGGGWELKGSVTPVPQKKLLGGLKHGFYDFPYMGNNHPNWRAYFSEGYVNHQPVKPLKLTKIMTVVRLLISGKAESAGILHCSVEFGHDESHVAVGFFINFRGTSHVT